LSNGNILELPGAPLIARNSTQDGEKIRGELIAFFSLTFLVYFLLLYSPLIPSVYDEELVKGQTAIYLSVVLLPRTPHRPILGTPVKPVKLVPVSISI